MNYHALKGNNFFAPIKDRVRSIRRQINWTPLDTYRVKLFAGFMACAVLGVFVGLGMSKSSLPTFDCQEDELMVWKDARHTSECVNIEEFVQDGLAPKVTNG